MYDDLERGSRNHLRAFFRHLQRHGGEYVPQYLSLSDFALLGPDLFGSNDLNAQRLIGSGCYGHKSTKQLLIKPAEV